jgi:hypothetical protein
VRWWLIILVLWVAPAMAIAVALLWGLLSGKTRWKPADPESSAEIVEFGDRSARASSESDQREPRNRARS